jgi:hypothetical protein
MVMAVSLVILARLNGASLFGSEGITVTPPLA